MNEHEFVVEEHVGEPESGALPCFVRHPDAGGQCRRAATTTVYGLGLCEPHGREVWVGMSMRDHQDAIHFFERFRAPHVPRLDPFLDRQIGAITERLAEEGPEDGHYDWAIMRAYPDTPERVRERIVTWERDEQAGRGTVLDRLLDSLVTLHDCMGVAFRGGETWLVEILEREREAFAVQAAYVLRRELEASEDRPAE